MAVRLSVVVASEELSACVSEALSGPETLVQTHPVRGDFWEQAKAPSDVLLASLSRLPEPVDDSVRSLCELPHSPKLILLTEGEDAELRATLLASGAECVLNLSIAKETWRDEVQSIMKRSCEEIAERLQPLPLHWLPVGWRDLPWTELRRILLSACENEFIRYHLTETKGRVGIVAQRTGLSNRAVRLMMNRQGVSKESFRNQTEDGGST